MKQQNRKELKHLKVETGCCWKEVARAGGNPNRMCRGDGVSNKSRIGGGRGAILWNITVTEMDRRKDKEGREAERVRG